MLVWKNSFTNEESHSRPVRVRMPDGLTKTAEEVTDTVLALAGWAEVEYQEPNQDYFLLTDENIN